MRFSVTIPAYKSQFLREAIESVICQTFSDWELVIVDDCSPENLRSIAEPFLTDKRISYYHNQKNCGAVNVVDNWNICLSHCNGEYIINMGDDDRLLPCCLEEYDKLINKYSDLDVFHGRTEIIDDHGTLVTLQEPRPEWESAMSLVWNRWAFRNKQFIGDFCYRTEHLKASGGYHKLPLAWGADDISAARAAKVKGIANTASFVFQYRSNRHTITNSPAPKLSKLKIEATIAQYHWFTSFLDEMSREALSEEDAKYLKTIASPRNDFFRIALANDCTSYIAGIPSRLIWCYNQLREMQYPNSVFFKWFLKSIATIISK